MKENYIRGFLFKCFPTRFVSTERKIKIQIVIYLQKYGVWKIFCFIFHDILYRGILWLFKKFMFVFLYSLKVIKHKIWFVYNGIQLYFHQAFRVNYLLGSKI